MLILTTNSMKCMHNFTIYYSIDSVSSGDIYAASCTLKQIKIQEKVLFKSAQGPIQVLKI